MIILADLIPIAVLGIVVLVFAAIGLVSYLIYRHLHPKLKDNEKIDEKTATEEELKRVLEPVEDEKLAEEIANYIDEEDEK